jgi:DNA-binding transcriptional MocR family regulator
MLLYENLAHDLSALIGSGQLRAGDRLPSVRHLAQQRQLSVSTVLQALRSLENRGIVEARPQSGYYVRGNRPRNVEVRIDAKLARPVKVGMTGRLMDVLYSNEAPGIAPLGSALPDPELLLAGRLNRLYASLARRHPKLLAGSSHADLSERPLVEAIMKRSLEWSYPLQAEEIIVTNSCTEAMTLCLRAVTKPGDTVAVESPTYYVMLQLLETLGLKALEIPTHPEHGVSVDALELATRNGQVAACLLIPNGANPLGCVIADENKQAIAALLAARNVPLIEDDIYGDICFSAVRPRPIHAFDTTGNTLLCTSFSKTVSPALRCGYVAAGKRTTDILLQKTLTSGKTNALTQRVIAELLDTRGFDTHLRTLRRRLSEQLGRTRDAVARYFPAETRVTDPQGGFVLWVELPKEIDTTALHARAIAAGVAYVPGEMFSASGKYRNFLRLACGHPWNDRLDTAVKRLGSLFCGK